eukprot:COSAG01_NODE_49_length_31891_cov_29.945773_21_plen_165_part_00
MQGVLGHPRQIVGSSHGRGAATCQTRPRCRFFLQTNNKHSTLTRIAGGWEKSRSRRMLIRRLRLTPANKQEQPTPRRGGPATPVCKDVPAIARKVALPQLPAICSPTRLLRPPSSVAQRCAPLPLLTTPPLRAILRAAILRGRNCAPQVWAAIARPLSRVPRAR